ncbi:MAG: allophanate hydrolase [Nevskia sp.]|nr:allophanate hydrolase [Nevskia sp.]
MKGQTLSEWRAAYLGGQLRPAAAMEALAAGLERDDPAWIRLFPAAELRAQAGRVEQALAAAGGDFARLPLYGIPFAVKDNIDVAGVPTTAACPEFAYLPQRAAAAVQRLTEAGAIVIGKTNLDQFATGLVGMRSPYGAVPNAFDERFVGGGSSSGSASVVARGIVPFALGTDTAGSGRVPASFNNIVGLKPTRGAVSSCGMVPACRTLDCISVFALTVEDAYAVFEQVAGFDAEDPYSRATPPLAAGRRFQRPARLGVPQTPQWFGDALSERAFKAALGTVQALGVELVPLDFSVLHEIAALLYNGPWVAERYVAIEGFLRDHAEAVHPVVREIIGRAASLNAAEAFKAEYRRAALKRVADQLIARVDALLVPTAPTIYTIAEVEADPIGLNSRLGTYTNFVNLLDWCALALPAGFREDGLPFGVTMIAPAWHDAALAAFGRAWQAQAPWTLGATGRSAPPAAADGPPPLQAEAVRLAVVGAHLSGMPLNRELTEREAVFVEATTTSAAYRLYALAGTVPPKPGLVKTGDGAPIQVELWDMPLAAFGSFVAGVPPPLGIGTLELADGRQVKGFICEPWALRDARDITASGGWRAYLAAQREGRA